MISYSLRTGMSESPPGLVGRLGLTVMALFVLCAGLFMGLFVLIGAALWAFSGSLANRWRTVRSGTGEGEPQPDAQGRIIEGDYRVIE